MSVCLQTALDVVGVLLCLVMIWIVFSLLCFGLVQCDENQNEDKLVFAQVVSEKIRFFS